MKWELRGSSQTPGNWRLGQESVRHLDIVDSLQVLLQLLLLVWYLVVEGVGPHWYLLWWHAHAGVPDKTIVYQYLGESAAIS